MKQAAYLHGEDLVALHLHLPPDAMSILQEKQTKMAIERQVRRVSRPLALTQILRDAKRSGLI